MKETRPPLDSLARELTDVGASLLGDTDGGWIQIDMGALEAIHIEVADASPQRMGTYCDVHLRAWDPTGALAAERLLGTVVADHAAAFVRIACAAYAAERQAIAQAMDPELRS
jgi:hypothetical protein